MSAHHATMAGLIGRFKLRSHHDHHRVTWLELFFDLIFVAAVAQVADPLREHYTVDGILRFAALFSLIWWAWTGYTMFASRFDTDEVVQKGFTLVQVFIVAVMAANATEALDSRSSAGFAAAYAVLRLVLVAQYVRARHCPGVKALTTRYIVGHGTAAALWLLSALVPAPARYAIWAVALVIDLGTPWLAIPHHVAVPTHAAHLPERFGLFTLILLGEAVVAVMHGMESQDSWPVAAAVSAFLGMALLFLIWWWYFEGADATAEQHIRTHRDAVRMHLWSYLHYPLYLGIVIMGVGLQRAVSSAARFALTASDATILTCAAAVIMTSLVAIAATSARRLSVRRGRLALALMLPALTIAAGVSFSPASPPVVVIGLAVVAALQAWSTLRVAPITRGAARVRTATGG